MSPGSTSVVTVAGQNCPVLSSTATQITCTLPAGESLARPVLVLFGTASSNVVTFDYGVWSENGVCFDILAMTLYIFAQMFPRWSQFHQAPDPLKEELSSRSLVGSVGWLKVGGLFEDFFIYASGLFIYSRRFFWHWRFCNDWWQLLYYYCSIFNADYLCSTGRRYVNPLNLCTCFNLITCLPFLCRRSQ